MTKKKKKKLMKSKYILSKLKSAVVFTHLHNKCYNIFTKIFIFSQGCSQSHILLFYFYKVEFNLPCVGFILCQICL